MSFEDYFSAFCCAFIAMLLPLGALAAIAFRRIRALETRLAALEAEPQATAVTPAAATPDREQIQPASKLPVWVETLKPAALVEEKTDTQPVIKADTAPVVTPSRAQQAAAKAVPPVAPQPKPDWEWPPLLNWFIKMHVMVQIGMLLFLIGIGLFLNFAFDQGWISVPLRHIGAAVVGVLVTGIGAVMRKKRRNYGLALQGSGIGILYLTTFFADRVFELLPTGVGFAIYVALSIVAVSLALLNDAWILAALAQVGAFVAPLIVVDLIDGHVGLFSYLLILNIAIGIIAWFKAWRMTNAIGLLGTITLATAWITAGYEPELVWSLEPFMFAFFGIFTLLPVFFVRHGKQKFSAIFDTLLLYLTPIWMLIMQSIIVEHLNRGMWWISLAIALIYLVLAGVLYGIDRRAAPGTGRFGYLREVFLFWAAVCLALAIPFAVDPNVTAAIWALLGLGYVVSGVARNQWWPVALGGLVQLAAASAYVVYVAETPTADWLPFLRNALYVGAALIGLSSFASSYVVQRRADFSLGWTQYPFFGWGLLWWLLSGVLQISEGAQTAYIFAGLLFFLSFTVVALYGVGRLFKWPFARQAAAYGLFLLPILLLIRVFIDDGNLLANGGWYAWPMAFATQYLVLKDQDSRKLAPVWHVSSFWSVVAWCIVQGGWGIQTLVADDVAWYALPVFGVLALALLLLSFLRDVKLWPLQPFQRAYVLWGALGLIGAGLLWALGTSLGNGLTTAPLPYVPIFNSYEIPLIAFFAASWIWVIRTNGVLNEDVRYYAKLALGLSGFILSNFVIARAVHHIGGVDYNFADLFYTPFLQTFYAMYWSLFAVILMFVANRKSWLLGWILGAILLGITVLKLFFVDLSNASSVARIVSFLVVGLLIVGVAYLAPAPTRPAEASPPDALDPEPMEPPAT